MISLNFDKTEIRTSDGAVWLALRLPPDSRRQARRFVMEFNGKLHTVEIYKGIVREIGPYKEFTMTTDEAKTFRVVWERLGIGWPVEQVDYTPDGDRVVLRAYYGSSTYNTKQMSLLIDRVIQDCQAVGIETMSDRERSLLLEDWDAQRNKSNVNSG